jgi:hypothetical protein
MVTRPSEGKLNVQADPQERSKRYRKCEQPSQGSPHKVKSKRKQALKMMTTKSADTTAAQTGLEQYGFGPTAGGGTQRRPIEERQQPSKDGEEHNRDSMPELTITAALSATPVREGHAEGQNSAETPRPTIRQDYLLNPGEENRWTKVGKSYQSARL